MNCDDISVAKMLIEEEALAIILSCRSADVCDSQREWLYHNRDHHSNLWINDKKHISSYDWQVRRKSVISRHYQESKTQVSDVAWRCNQCHKY